MRTARIVMAKSLETMYKLVDGDFQRLQLARDYFELVTIEIFSK